MTNLPKHRVTMSINDYNRMTKVQDPELITCLEADLDALRKAYTKEQKENEELREQIGVLKKGNAGKSVTIAVTLIGLVLIGLGHLPFFG